MRDDMTEGGSARRMFARFATVAAFVLTILMLTPFEPGMPFVGVDGSWRYAINVAAAEHLRFGRDIVFTFGPLASVYTHEYHPFTDGSMIVGSLLVAMAVFLGFFTIVASRRRYLLLLLPVVISLSWRIDALYFFLPILLPFVARKNIDRGKAASLTLYVVAIASATLLLIKLNFTLMVGVSTLLTIVLLWRASRMTAIVLCTLQAVTLAVGWLLCGQSLVDLPSYFIAQGSIISGYTDGMSVDGRLEDVVAFLLASIAMVATTVAGQIRRQSFVALLFCFYLFVAFKSGFVRHDGHALVPSVALAYVGLLLILERGRQAGMSAFIIGLLGWAMISGNYQDNRFVAMTSRFAEMVRNPARGIWLRMTQPEVLPNQFRATTAFMGSSSLFAKRSGTADLYSMDLAPMIAAGIDWKPRPVIQSYAAYTSPLAILNAAHLSNDPPSRVFFTISPIDNHYPSLEDGLSWLSLLGNFNPVVLDHGYAVLEKPAKPLPPLVPIETLSSDAILGKGMPVPRMDSPIWVSMDITPSLAGKIFSIAYKLPELSLVVRYENGDTASYRFIAGMARTGFLLSPTISNATDFVALGSSYRDDLLSKRRVASFMILGESGTRILWRNQYKVVFSRLDISRKAEADKTLAGTWEDSQPLAEYPVGGDCNIDEVNQAHVTASTMDLPLRMVTIRGWAALDAAAGARNEGVSLAFTGRDGRTRILRANVAIRQDVANAFHHQGLAEAGYEANVDVRQLPDDVQVRVIQRDGNRHLLCVPAMLTIHRVNDYPAGFMN